MRVLEALKQRYSFEIQLPDGDARTIDVALCLETSATDDARKTVERFMEAGAVTFVPRTALYEELPEGAVVKIDTDSYGEALLAAYLEQIFDDENLRARLSENARRFISDKSTTASGRFIKPDGMDFKRGAIEYPRRLKESDRSHLFTKPFYDLANKVSRWSRGGLDDDAHRQLTDFANLARLLALPSGARILDIGCGSGWLSEYFARLGYDVTGIDISPDLIEIARARLAHAQSLYAQSSQEESFSLKCRFFAHDIEAAPLEESFDAIICYDSLHHFEDERKVLSNVAAMLGYGGLFFVLEGERPPDESETARELLGVMRDYETLESPFSRDYLLSILREHGFAIAGDYLSASDLFERWMINAQGRITFAPETSFNYLLCKLVGPKLDATRLKDSRAPGNLRARFKLLNEWRERVAEGETLRCEFEVENLGDTLWLASRRAIPGTVRVAARVLDEEGAVLDEVHGVPSIDLPLAPGERVALSFERRAQYATGSYTLKIDLIDQDICWFEEQGSEPLLLDFEVEG